MKMTKTFAALGILGAALLAFASCKDSSGDGAITGGESAKGVPTKYALQMTVDATGDNIKVGGKAIIDSNTLAEATILADTEEGKTTASTHELERQRCGKRFFKEISGGLNNTEGFRTNIVLDLKNGTWVNAETGRTAGAGMLFDFNKYKDDQNKDIYDFFFLSFKPEFNSSGYLITNQIQMNFERYTGVKKTEKGIYSSVTEAKALGDCYVQTARGGNVWTDVANLTNILTYELEDGFYYDAGNQRIIIGVDVKQLSKGLYTVRVGTINYLVKDEPTEFTPSQFKQSWQTTFTSERTIGACGDPDGVSRIASSAYDNWTHVGDDDASNLKGAVLVYGFAPYGTKPVASYYTCSTKLSSNTVDNTDSRVDYVGDWNVANELDVDGVEDKIFYEEGNVVQEYVYY